MQALTYDGLNLADYCHVRVSSPLAASRYVETVEVPGRDGDIITDERREPFVATVRCVLKSQYLSRWSQVRARLASLARGGEHVLTLPDENGYRLATMRFDGDVETPFVPPVSFDMTFTDHDAVAYGITRTNTIPSHGSLFANVGGTTPPIIRISCDEARRDPSTHLWGVTVGDGLGTLYVELPTSQDTAVSIDCEERRVTIGGEFSNVTSDSDWPEIDPADWAGDTDLHLVAFTMTQGTGVATATIIERWL